MATIGLLLLLRELYIEYRQMKATTAEECAYWNDKRWAK